MTLWILKSGVCDSVVLGKYSNCKIAHGGRTVIIACTLWFAAGVMLIKWPRKKETRQRHSTLAGDETEEDKNVYPEIVGFWQHFMQDLDEEQQLELEKMRGGRPGMGAPQSSLHSMMQSFDDELSVCSNTSIDPKRVRQTTTTTTTTTTTNTGVELAKMREGRPGMGAPQSSLHSMMMEAFDDELSVCSNTSTSTKKKRRPLPTTSTSGESTGEANSSSSTSRSPSWRAPRLGSASMQDEINLRRPSLHEFLESFDNQDIL
jgi:hypothetical protein